MRPACRCPCVVVSLFHANLNSRRCCVFTVHVIPVNRQKRGHQRPKSWFGSKTTARAGELVLRMTACERAQPLSADVSAAQSMLCCSRERERCRHQFSIKMNWTANDFSLVERRANLSSPLLFPVTGSCSSPLALSLSLSFSQDLAFQAPRTRAETWRSARSPRIQAEKEEKVPQADCTADTAESFGREMREES